MFILDLLAAFVMLLPWLETGPNLIPETGPNLILGPRLVFFLVILLVPKDISFMIWLLGLVLSPGMLSSKSPVFLLNIGLLNPTSFLL